MSVRTFLEGTRVRVTATFVDFDGTVVDPDTVTFSVKDPAGTVTVYSYPSSEVAKISTGVYTYTAVPNQTGVWRVRTDGDGVPVTASCETAFEVLEGDVL